MGGPPFQNNNNSNSDDNKGNGQSTDTNDSILISSDDFSRSNLESNDLISNKDGVISPETIVFEDRNYGMTSPLVSPNLNEGISHTPQYTRYLEIVEKATGYISKALDLVEHRTPEQRKEWEEHNTEFYTRLYEKSNGEDMEEIKSNLYQTWAHEIEEKFVKYAGFEGYEIFKYLRMSYQVLYDSDRKIKETKITPKVTIRHKEKYDFDAPSSSPDLPKPKSRNISDRLKYAAQKMTKFLKTKGLIVKKFLRRKFTLIDLITTYKKEYLQNDISVGISSGTMIIPQSMAYAFLAGLPPIQGLYTAFIPAAIYCLFGSSRHLAVGPLALMSIMVGAAVQGQEPKDNDQYISYANLLALMVGVNYLLMGFLQLGYLINFLSRPVLSGFTSAAAIIIILSQANSLFGIKGDNQPYAWKYFYEIAKGLPETQWIAVVMAIGCFTLLYVFKNYFKTIPKTTIPVPAPLILVVLGLIISFFADFEGRGLALVKEIPSSLPFPFGSWQSISFDVALSLYKEALVIPVIGLIETVSAAKAAANKCKYDISMGNELTALGMANLFSWVFQGYPCAGAFGRTSLHMSSGAKTQLTTIVSVVVVGLTLLFLTPVFYYLPKVVLAAIVIFAVSQLIDLEEVQNLWRINKIDMLLLLVAFWTTIVLGVQPGIAVSVILSLVLVIYQSSRPNCYIVGRIPGTTTYNDIDLYPEAITENNVVVFRFDAPIIFCNSYYLRKQLKKIYKNEDDTKNANVSAIVLDCSSVTNIDSTGVKYLKELIRELVDLKIPMCFADVRPNVVELLKLSGVYRDLGGDHFFVKVHEAVVIAPKLTIRPIVEPKAGLKLNCFKKRPDGVYTELY
ncbi:hypothetical protein PPL_07960 [Heterostelium album PN500]|uniref:STAS domain-containing protein n=1 Tax=Heterostelium pallidum (strain ATCC 26659 / Pp 5 / PN500) TaxID=670386 RepID=D3BHF8_HETP5|nr:hypothetical protein PPL_07960 [Heterostelium album PN500]EFA79135.1 hypothetical protein PPL_07960 [Heterostelium album PN500]|eukprot:XP_020431257.1 hypothetical protein PPL_07960 [Heterostelium album PN500]